MDFKPRPNDEAYFRMLRAMTPQQRLAIAMYLSDFERASLLARLRRENPQLREPELKRLRTQTLYPECFGPDGKFR